MLNLITKVKYCKNKMYEFKSKRKENFLKISPRERKKGFLK